MSTQQRKPFNILVIGESCLDVFIYGACSRMSPEAPVPVLDANKKIESDGMAGNVASNLLGLGCNVMLITDDSVATKTRYIDERSNQHLVRVDTSRSVEPLNVNRFDQIKDEIDAVIFSDYNKGFLPHSVIIESLNKIQDSLNCPVFVDSKKSDLSCYTNCTMKINEKEFNIAKSTIDSSVTLIQTLGKNGAQWNNKMFKGNVVDVFDVAGAGDTFLSGYVARFLETRDVEKSIKFANKCAAFAVSKRGAYAIQSGDVA